ncbi:ABC transporter substrate-binding protein [uncultured Ferrimonas sp.]|uniref:MlaC/ttg2D family ABC transporter substrate-binding protein n=1 Tax=uncultured Ferrimonas sp. TaxID=432640 RepID=UPI0026122D42|nr:ABC transporter substrate-binding protein [uncultured Ferrimonas sp.]
MIKQLVQGLLLTAVLLAPALATIDQTEPYAMVEQVATELLTDYTAQRSAIEQDPTILRQLVETELMPYVNHTYAAYKVMGKAVRKATPAQRQRFTEQFRQYMISTFAQTFTVYTDQRISYEPAKAVGKRGIVNVGMTFIDGNRPPVEVKFKMRLNKKSGKWQAIDLIAEGASILAAKESEFGGLIRQQGLDAVSDLLAEKNRIAMQPEQS